MHYPWIIEMYNLCHIKWQQGQTCPKGWWKCSLKLFQQMSYFGVQQVNTPCQRGGSPGKRVRGRVLPSCLIMEKRLLVDYKSSKMNLSILLWSCWAWKLVQIWVWNCHLPCFYSTLSTDRRAQGMCVKCLWSHKFSHFFKWTMFHKVRTNEREWEAELNRWTYVLEGRLVIFWLVDGVDVMIYVMEWVINNHNTLIRTIRPLSKQWHNYQIMQCKSPFHKHCRISINWHTCVWIRILQWSTSTWMI
mgnify:CR=1 FL=1